MLKPESLGLVYLHCKGLVYVVLKYSSVLAVVECHLGQPVKATIVSSFLTSE